MNYLEEIINNNKLGEVNIQELLKDSVYYPASGIDGRGIEALKAYSHSFIHADYNLSKEVVREAMENDFKNLAYKTIGIQEVSVEDFGFYDTPTLKHLIESSENEREITNTLHALSFRIQESENERKKFLAKAEKKAPFALWSVYKYEGNCNNYLPYFSLLHFRAEATDVLEKLYYKNKINPKGIAIFNPGEGYGDNWTIFRNPEYRFYQTLLANVNHNKAQFPKYIGTNLCSKDDNCFWPNYQSIKYYKKMFGVAGFLYEVNILKYT